MQVNTNSPSFNYTNELNSMLASKIIILLWLVKALSLSHICIICSAIVIVIIIILFVQFAENLETNFRHTNSVKLCPDFHNRYGFIPSQQKNCNYSLQLTT